MELLLKDNLQKMLEANSLNPTQLARLTGVNAQTVHNWLSGQKPRNIEHVKLIATFFNVSIDHLCFGESLTNNLEKYQDEISAGIFEVVLRKVNHKK